jgi:hypothetical protein
MMYRRDELRDNTLLHTWRDRSRIVDKFWKKKIFFFFFWIGKIFVFSNLYFLITFVFKFFRFLSFNFHHHFWLEKLFLFLSEKKKNFFLKKNFNKKIFDKLFDKYIWQIIC